MTIKPKPPAKPAPRPKTPQPRQPVANPSGQADSRWQRTVRYGWDKGGAKGGR